MKTWRLGHYVEESLSTCKFLSGFPLIIGIQRPALPIIACQTINAATFFFPGAAHPPSLQGIEIIITLPFMTFYPPASLPNNILFFIIMCGCAAGGSHMFGFCSHELGSGQMCVVSNSARAFAQITNLLFVKGFAYIVPDVLVTGRPLALLSNSFGKWQAFIKETMGCEWTERRTELNTNSSQKQQNKQKIAKFKATPTHTDTQSHICDPHVIIHLTITNLLWHISHDAAKPLKRPERLERNYCSSALWWLLTM